MNLASDLGRWVWVACYGGTGKGLVVATLVCYDECNSKANDLRAK
jgi:hypothetical protein